jgi:hypothetical protein
MRDSTPRTDLEKMGTYDESGCYSEDYPIVSAEFAMELERELNELIAKIGHSMKTEPPESTDSLPPTFKRIALLFTKRCTRTKFAKGEKKAWDRVKDTIKEHDIELLEWFYALDKSVDCDCTWRRVKMPATLLNSLEAQLDQAYEHKEAMRKSQPKLGTPTQW